MGERLDGGERSVIGADLSRTVGGRGDRFDKGSGESKALEAAKAGDLGPVDPENPKGLRPFKGMTREQFLGVKDLTDAELADRVLAIEVYRANGYSIARAARQLKVPVALARVWLAKARERKLTLPALDAARVFVEDNLVDMAVDGLHAHLKQRNLEASLATLRGTGVLRNHDTPQDGRLPMQLNVQIVDADGVVISVGNKAPTLAGVIGVPKAHRLDVAAPKDDL